MNPAKTMTIVMAMLIISMTAIQGAPDEKGAQEKSDLQVVCSPELENLANQLVSDYMKENEGMRISVTPAGDKDMYSSLPEGSIALLNKECISGIEGEQYFKMAVGRDAIIPIMNAANPQKEYILENGISPEVFARIYSSGEKLTWGEVVGTADSHPVNAFAPGTSCAKNYMADFLQTKAENLKGFDAMAPEALMKEISKDPNALGFCSLSCLMNLEKSGMAEGIGLVPVDNDGNGKISEFEDIYKSGTLLSHAIYVGRFPRALYSRIYAVTGDQPAGDGEMAFLQWILTGGQESFASTGMVELGYGERTSALEKIAGNDLSYASVPVKSSPARVYLVVGGLLLLLGILVYAIAMLVGRRSQAPAMFTTQGAASSSVPGGLFFDNSHTWAFMEKSGRVRIGIDDFIQNVTGPVTRVLMKQPGEKIKRGDHFLTLIQNGKRLEIKSPLTGVIEEQNEDLLEDATLLNSDPYTEGWVLMVKPQNWISELKSYFMGQPYTEWLKTEAVRLKDFFASAMNMEDTKEPALVMQDGGEIRGGVLESFGPEVWEEFQNTFINNAKY